MIETTFENAQNGDRVWSPHFGWGTIDFKLQDHLDYPISVDMDRGRVVSYTKQGWADVDIPDEIY